MVVELEALAKTMRRVTAEVQLVGLRAKQAELLEAYTAARAEGSNVMSQKQAEEWTERWKTAETALGIANDAVAEVEQFGGIR